MKTFNKITALVAAAIVLLFVAANILTAPADPSADRPHIVEITRISRKIAENGLNSISLADCDYITAIRTGDTPDLFTPDADYVIQEINGTLYRFDYRRKADTGSARTVVNLILAAMAAVTMTVLLYIRSRILKPFDRLKDVPYELSKGNLTAPVKESKSRFFGKFIWGVDLLRENIEQQKSRELDLLREKKTMLLSLSHDIKTPLSAIKLYSGALSKGLYTDPEKQRKIAENINSKADEIEGYVSQIITTSREDFLTFDVVQGEFYLSQLVSGLAAYYTEKMDMVKTEFRLDDYTDCMLTGDLDRAVEVMQNIIENALKYGDGEYVRLSFSEEDGCQLMSVTNSGCTLPEGELPHIFESFWRGSNTGNAAGSGLGLYICRQLMNLMGGEIFAELNEGTITVTAVFTKP